MPKAPNIYQSWESPMRDTTTTTTTTTVPFTVLSAAAGILHLRTFGHPLDDRESLALDQQTLALFEKVKRIVDDRDALRSALRATNEEIIRYGTSPDTYDWADMTARTRANAKIAGGGKHA